MADLSDTSLTLRRRLPWMCGILTAALVVWVALVPRVFETPPEAEQPGWDPDSWFYDKMFQLRDVLGLEGPADAQVVHIDIDDATLDELRTRWPLTRVEQAMGFEALLELGVGHAVFDIEYLDKAPWDLNVETIEILREDFEAGMDRVTDVVRTSKDSFERDFEINQFRTYVGGLLGEIARDPDERLVPVLQALRATIAIHSEVNTIRPCPEKLQARFADNPLWPEEDDLSPSEFQEARTWRQSWIAETMTEDDVGRSWPGPDGLLEHLVRRWPVLGGNLAGRCLQDWHDLHAEARAREQIARHNSLPVDSSRGAELHLFPPHPSILSRWRAEDVRAGFVDARSEPDGLVRRVPLWKDVAGRRYFQMALRGHLAWKGIPLESVGFEDEHVVVGDDIRIPVEDGRWMRLDWRLREADRERQTVSFKDLYTMRASLYDGYGALVEAIDLESQAGHEHEVAGIQNMSDDDILAFARKFAGEVNTRESRRSADQAVFLLERSVALRDRLRPRVAGKIAFVGLAATSSTDRRPTPLKDALDMVDLHATLVDNILQGQYKRRLSAPWQGALVALVMGLLSAVLLHWGFKEGLLAWLGSLVLIVATGFALFHWGGWLVRGLSLMTGVSVLMLTVTGTKQLIEFIQKRFFRTTLSQYLSPNVAKYIEDNPQALVEMNQGKKIRMTVLFADIRGFTPFCEPLSPTEVKEAVNRIMDALTPCVFEFDGTLDKYMGDCIMAFFGAPMEYPDHALQAARCGLKMREVLDRLVEEFTAEGLKPLDMGIGISTGEMTVANLGASNQSDYSVLGDAVNLGARIEGLTRPLEANILITDETYRDIKDLVEARDRGTHPVKGKSQEVRIWELLGFQSDDDSSEAHIHDQELVNRLRGR